MTKDRTPLDLTGSVSPSETTGESALYRYEPSGIVERSGHIPIWLKLVVFALIVWGLYYAWRYWNSY